MSDATELKACPFCGVCLIANTSQDDLYVKRYGTHWEHPSGLCFMDGAEVTPSQVDAWNSRAAPIAPAEDAQPGMSRHSRAMLLNVLWHHQGAGSEVGQPLRVMLGIGKHDHMTDAQVSEAKWIDGLLSEAKFKNFHRLLCERFGYVHDDVDWKRDQLSLIEHIAAPSPKAPAYSAPFTTDVPQCCGDPSTCNDPCQPKAPAVEAGARKLAVWYGALPESNGMTNWTAILHKGDVTEGITIDRSEYPDRVRYEADRMRWMIGELDEEPFILDYDADKHSGYAPPSTGPAPLPEATRKAMGETPTLGKVEAGADPVAWMSASFPDGFTKRKDVADRWEQEDGTVIALYDRPIEKAATNATAWRIHVKHKFGEATFYSDEKSQVNFHRKQECSVVTPLYTAPPAASAQKGLTDEQIIERAEVDGIATLETGWYRMTRGGLIEFARALLRESEGKKS